MTQELKEMMNILWNMATTVPEGHPVEPHLDNLMNTILDAINAVKEAESK